MTPLNEYDFEVRKAQPADPGKAQPLTYWRRALAAIDALGDGESLFFRHQDEAPTDKQLAKMRGNIAAQMKRHRPNVFKCISVPADGGVYVYFAMKSPTPNAALSAQNDLELGPEDPDAGIGPEPANALEAEDDDLLAFPLQGEAPGFDDREAEIVEVRDNPKIFREPVVCKCPVWWQAAPQFKRNDPKAKGAHHSDLCPLYSLWETLNTVPPCSCDGYYRERHPNRNHRGVSADDWYQPGDWHEKGCPRHVHKWKLPAADQHEAGTPFVGVCRCGESKDSQPYQNADSDLMVDGRAAAKTAAGLVPARAPAPLEAPVSAVQPSRPKGSRMCPNCGSGYTSLNHKTTCKGWTEGSQ